jgi:hypothetical protein
MLRFCYQTHDAICDELDTNKDFFLFDFSTTKITLKMFLKNIYFLKATYIFKVF